MEEYAAKMQAKSEDDLRQYVRRHTEYRDDAVLAALAELRRRGIPAPEEAALRPALEAAVAQQAAEDATRPAAADPAAAAGEGPELYSQGTIVLFSMLFSMVAGGVLLGINLRRLRRTGALVGLVVFMLALAVATRYTLEWALKQFSQNMLVLAFLPLAFNVVGLVVYLTWFWPRYVGTQAYRSRSWLLPFMLCLALAFAWSSLVVPLLIKSGALNRSTVAPAGRPTAPTKMP